MKKILITLAVVFAMVGCTDADNAVKVLQANGFTNIQTTGYSFFSCGNDDSQATGFTAIGPTGIPVKGAVCSSIFVKNSTIRFE